ncbi:MAG: tyrosine--tRNA ligase [Candidatus Nezhaarchaeales archaeon]
MNLNDKLKLIERNTAEILTRQDLVKLLNLGEPLKGYIGVEPSGLFHLGWIIWANKLADLINVGVDMLVLEATWHAWINDKLGGSLDNIHKCAKYIEHCLSSLGVERVKYVKAEDLVSDPDYWKLVVRIAKKSSLARIKKAVTIMGRKQSEAVLDFSKLIYPCMQVADIFYLGVNVALGGTDQRKAHVLARELMKELKHENFIAIHTPLLLGLKPFERVRSGEQIVDVKMSKSKPENCIFIHDSPEEIERKLLDAYCPPKEVELNPVLDICRYILFAKEGFTLDINRPLKYGGPITAESMEHLETLYVKGELHPLDLKRAVAKALSQLLRPSQEYFKENSEASRLLNEIKGLTITK